MYSLSGYLLLGLLSDLVDVYLTITSTGQDKVAIHASVAASHSNRLTQRKLVVGRSLQNQMFRFMSFLNQVSESSSLRQEGPDVAIAPATDDTLTVGHKL